MYDTLKKCVEWYKLPNNDIGGELHIILDDDNIDDYFIDLCIEKTENKDAFEILQSLKKLSMNQRIWVTYNIYTYMESGTVNQIYEEY